jgi:cytochrome o ubiquinol oxidase subunit 2
MRLKYKIAGGILCFVAVIFIAVVLLHGAHFSVLSPKGTIADKQRNLIIFTSLLSLIVVIPVFIMLFGFAWKYREGNKKADYKPDWDHNRVAETIWWVLPCVIIAVLSVITWQTSHSLDPYKALDSSVKPLKVQVVALQWKWLFIYPDQQVASVNTLHIPKNTPIDFEITADAPMNSFWIPSLGGQVYAMSGMSTQLHLQADTIGSYDGSSANISGKGFAGMKFKAEVTSQDDFTTWWQDARASQNLMNESEYAKLVTPTENVKPATFALMQPSLYDTIVAKYMNQPVTSHDEDSDDHHDMEMH